MLPQPWSVCARQSNREFSEFAHPAVYFDRTAVLLGDDVIGAITLAS
jgi:hypothetical protein